VIPTTPNEPQPPSFTQDGMLVGGTSALANAVAWVTRRVEYYEETVKENRTDTKDDRGNFRNRRRLPAACGSNQA